MPWPLRRETVLPDEPWAVRPGPPVQVWHPPVGEPTLRSDVEGQEELFPEHLAEALAPGDPVFFISDLMMDEVSLQYCYNALAATSEDGVILAVEITTSPRDVSLLVPMVEAVKANTGRRLGIAIADNGYLSESNLKQLRRKRQRCLVAAGREGKKPTKWPKGRLTRRMLRPARVPQTG